MESPDPDLNCLSPTIDNKQREGSLYIHLPCMFEMISLGRRENEKGIKKKSYSSSERDNLTEERE